MLINKIINLILQNHYFLDLYQLNHHKIHFYFYLLLNLLIHLHLYQYFLDSFPLYQRFHFGYNPQYHLQSHLHLYPYLVGLFLLIFLICHLIRHHHYLPVHLNPIYLINMHLLTSCHAHLITC